MASGTTRNWLYRDESLLHHVVDDDIARHWLADETQTTRFLLDHARLDPARGQAVQRHARNLVKRMRTRQRQASGLDAFLSEYDLSSREGVVLMCLAEALLRVPDSQTADRLIADKLGEADFSTHLGSSESLFVNASTWALMLTGRMLRPPNPSAGQTGQLLKGLLERMGEPLVRTALRQAMKILGRQFVMGRTMDEALRRAGDKPAYLYSFDMLGEAAMTDADAQRYLSAYRDSIHAIATRMQSDATPMDAPGISVKLSALEPRFEHAQLDAIAGPLSERVLELATTAAKSGIALTIDAEEADRLEVTLAIFAIVARSRQLAGYSGLGIAVQAYQKRAWHVLQWLEELARECDRVIPVRLVKGAYWDTEIKRAQEQGLAGYPVFTRKANTDVSYLACARALLSACPHLYPQFATHNAHTVAWLLESGRHRQFEFQRLHGMGEALYQEADGSPAFDRPCRVYAPVGSHEELLPYLVRRLLENGANTSFVNRLAQERTTPERIVEDPAERVSACDGDLGNPRIPPPRDLFQPSRLNARGANLADSRELRQLAGALKTADTHERLATPVVNGKPVRGEAHPQYDPADRRRISGQVHQANADTARQALKVAHDYFPTWEKTPAAARADMLRRAADLFETHSARLIAVCVAEGGRTVRDSMAEVREAVDFLRYYASESEALFGSCRPLPGPTGERNSLHLQGRGVFMCISPWNFPLAIFTGQIAAALAAGNTVLAKPAEQGSLSAALASELLWQAGVPAKALQLLPGDGATLGDALLGDSRIAGVAFTGSVATARRIAGALSATDGPLPALIAETGGINAMIVDSSALAEQVVRDVTTSAFNSAGQRCSALRLLCLQDDCADRIVTMLRGHMDRLVIGDPALLATDVGPVIDADAQSMLQNHVASMQERVLHQCELEDIHRHGTFFPPTLIELASPAELTIEVFGPVLHVVRYREKEIDALIDAINASGFGLTLGIHSRIDSFASHVSRRARVGNIYVNRNMIGAVVGVQPFGGMGLSGTGPKAGGPHYLLRFASEQTLTMNTAAIGGNAALLSLDDTPTDRS